MSYAPEFVVCVSNDGYPASLEPGKVYQAIADPDVETLDLIRVIDESGEDYLFQKVLFLPVERLR